MSCAKHEQLTNELWTWHKHTNWGIAFKSLLVIQIDNNMLGIQAHNAMPKAFAISKKVLQQKCKGMEICNLHKLVGYGVSNQQNWFETSP